MIFSLSRLNRLFFLLAISFASLSFVSVADAAVVTWDNGGGDSNWSTCENWSGDSCPGSSDVATFDATSDTASTIDAAFAGAVKGIDINSGYNSTITQAASTTLIIGVDDINIASGTLTMASDGAFDVDDDVTIAGGTFNAGGTLNLKDDWFHTAGGVFNHSNGTVIFDDNSASNMDFDNVGIATSGLFYNLTINKSDGVGVTVNASDKATIVNTLTISDGQVTGGNVSSRLYPQGNVVVGANADNSTVHMEFTGTADQNMNLTGATGLFNGHITINKTSGAVSLLSDLIMDAGGQDLTIADGELDPNGNAVSVKDLFTISGGVYALSASTLTLENSLVITSGTFNAPSTTMYVANDWTHDAGGTFAHNNGTVVFNTGTATAINSNSGLTGSGDFYNLTINKNDGVAVTVNASDTIEIGNTLTITDGQMTGGNVSSRVYPQSNVVVGANADNSTLHMEFTGTNAQNFDLTGAEANYNGIITINKASGTVTLLSDLTMDAGGQDFYVTSGSFDPNDNNVFVKDLFTQSGGTYVVGTGTLDIDNNFILSGGVHNAPSSTMYVSNDWTHTAGGTFNHSDGTVEFDTGVATTLNFESSVPTSGEFYNLTINKSDNVAVSPAVNDEITVYNNMTFTEGKLTQYNDASLLNVQGHVTVGSAMDSSTIHLQFNGTNAQNFTLTGAVALYDGKVTVNKPSGTVTLQSDYTLDNANKDLVLTSGTLALNGNDLTVNGTSSEFTLGGSATLQLNGDETITANGGFPTFASGSTVAYVGTGGPYTLIDYAYHHLTINGAGAVFNAGKTWAFPGNLTISNGTFATGGYDISVAGTFSNEGTFRVNGTETLSMTHDSDSGTYEYIGDGDASADTFYIYGGAHNNLTVNMTDSEDTLATVGNREKATLTDDLWLYWKLDDGTGSGTAADASGNARTGSLRNTDNDTVWVSGASPIDFTNTGAIDFDGVNDHVEFTSDSGFVDRAVSLWFRAPDVTSRQVLYEEGGQSAGMNMYVEGGKVYGGAWGGSITNRFISTTTTVTTNTWYHVIAMYDSDGNFEIFLNGTSEATGAPGGDMPSHSAQDALGAMLGDSNFHDGTATGENYHFGGEIDDFRIYSRILNADEIFGLKEGEDVAQEVVNVTDLTIADTLTLASGSFTSPTTLRVGGNWANSGGSFTHNSGTVILNNAGNDALITGSHTFNNFSVTTANKNVNFTAGTTQTVNGTLTLTGSSGNLITLRSSSGGSQWNLNVAGSSSVDYVDVKDSDASSGNAITHAVNASRSTDSGNNENWSFNEAPTVASVSASQGANGDGDVTLIFVMDDADDDDTLQAKIEYSINGGSSWADPTLTTTDSEITASAAGDPTVNNALDYQVGQSGAYILSSSGANTISVVWEAATDVAADTDISNAQIRVTPYDGTEAGTVGTSSNFELDVKSPDAFTSGDHTVLDDGLRVTWTASADTNFSHYEIWYALTQSDVDSRVITAFEWDTDNDTDLATVSTVTTDITGFNPSTYFVKIYAIDDYGNEATVDAYQVIIEPATDSSSSSTASDENATGGSGIPLTPTTSVDETEETEVEVTVEVDVVPELTPEEAEDFWVESELHVLDEHWSAPYVEELRDNPRIAEVAGEMPTFNDLVTVIHEEPDEGMTREESTELLLVLAGYEVEAIDFDEEADSFNDLEADDDHSGMIQFAMLEDLVNGHPDGSFRPDLVVNRVEAIKMAAYFFGEEMPEELYGDDLLAAYSLEVNPFPDVDLDSWYAPYVMQAYTAGVVEGYDNGFFEPDDEISYSEFLKIATLYQNLDQAVQLSEEFEGKPLEMKMRH